uniref:Uncharacterized protein n=1 Tax=Elaeophora elaphi TaxID=1147741 RepID=A0A0R3S099_9BILA
MLRMNFKNYFDSNFSPTAKIDITISPIRWETTPVERDSPRPRFIRIMAQDENIVLLRAFIFTPERSWIVIDLNTMKMSTLQCQRFAR